jgi:hypothetical protein
VIVRRVGDLLADVQDRIVDDSVGGSTHKAVDKWRVRVLIDLLSPR